MVAALGWAVPEGISEQMTIKLSSEGYGATRDNDGRDIPDGGNSECKRPQVTSWVRAKVAGEVNWVRLCRNL